jgi:hypothetical protein
MVDPPTYRAEPDPEFADRLERELLQRLAVPVGSATAPHRDPDDPDGEVITLESNEGRRGQDPMTVRHPGRGRWLLVAAVAAVIAILAAFLASPSEDDEQVPIGPPPGLDAGDMAFCDEIEDIGLSVAIGEGYEGLDEALIDAEEIAPAAISAAVTAMADENRAQVAAGPPPEGTLPNPAPDAYFTAAAEVGDYLADHCDYRVIDVTSTDHAFAGIPAEAARGKTLFLLTNDGTEYHDFAVQRVSPGETRSLEEILALPDGGGDLLDYQANAFTPPGHRNWIVVDLKPNRYIAECSMPIGATTPEALRNLQADDTTPRHHTQGMTADFHVA